MNDIFEFTTFKSGYLDAEGNHINHRELVELFEVWLLSSTLPDRTRFILGIYGNPDEHPLIKEVKRLYTEIEELRGKLNE